MLAKRGRHGAPWTPEEDAELRRLCSEGSFIEDIARTFSRSAESVRTRANVLGIPCRSARRTQARGPKSKPIASRAAYRLVCRNSAGETLETRELAAKTDAEAIAAAKSCSAPGGCEAWKTGEDPELLGRF